MPSDAPCVIRAAFVLPEVARYMECLQLDCVSVLADRLN